MILVTGATGLVGSHLLYHLLEKEASVIALFREGSDREQVRQVFRYYTSEADAYFDRIEWRMADINDVPALEAAFQKVTQVYHCAALISFDPKDYNLLKKVNVEGTANVVNLCLSHHIQKLCYVSSIATLGTAVKGTAISEETHWNSEGENSVYAIAKYGAEMEVWRGSQEGLQVVIVNPGVIIGEGHWDSASAAVIKTGTSGIPIYTSGTLALVDVQDVVHVMVQLMHRPISQERFLLVGATLPYQELLSFTAQLAGKKPPRIFIAQWKMQLISAIEGVLRFMFRWKRKLSPATVRSMYAQEEYDASKIKETLSFRFTPINETLQRVVRRYQESSDSTD
ncbi:NAD-dependent epimerase/dehydratase family protein [Altibacter sp. HG106]|uniref:NAD-dependent epimerase/dehydratase family protein n=1 Tax=Altibacter sp. HG106 TaxID=3023937 RepID=UPI0023503BEE|nr:NAD-dependent epimerase/dehydratase family protein [Altibacter sp. HG106]MDC7995262.1 NAD-dependent epimerase/dehydratase family protein [Altibacter sp. HG106]